MYAASELKNVAIIYVYWQIIIDLQNQCFRRYTILTSTESIFFYNLGNQSNDKYTMKLLGDEKVVLVVSTYNKIAIILVKFEIAYWCS